MIAQRFARLSALLAGLTLVFGTTAHAAGVPNTLEQRLMSCSACHGTHGEGSMATAYVPRIAALPARYIREQLLNFHNGTRHYGEMNNQMAWLSDAYIDEIANYLANLPAAYGPPQATTLSRDEAVRAEALVRHGDSARQLPACVSCHGDALTGVQPAVPGLLGLPRDYLRAQLGSWRTGERRSAAPDCMAKVVERMSPSDIALVSAWLAARVPGPVDRRPAAGFSARPPLACGVLEGGGP
jgi:cytochrome c553